MKEEVKSTFDGGVSTIAGQFGITGSGPVAIFDNVRSRNTTAAEDMVNETAAATGLQLNIPEGDTELPAPDGGRGWLIVLVAGILYGFSSFQLTVQSKTLLFYTGHKKTLEQRVNLTDEQVLEQRLDHWLDILFAGDQSLTVQQNLSLVLHQLGRVDQFQDIINAKKLEILAEHTVLNDVIQAVQNTQKTVFSLFGIVSSALILALGYRWVCLAGSVIMTLGCLATTFCHNCDSHLISFLYGAVPGLGQNMIHVSITVAVLEYFKRKRLLALMLLTAIIVVLSLATAFLMLFAFEDVGINDWKSYLVLQTTVLGLTIPGSLLLKPLNLRMKEGGTTFISKVFGMDGLKIYKSPELYTFALVWFFIEAGNSIILAKLPIVKAPEIWSLVKISQLLVMVLGLASFIGIIIPCCLRNSLRLKSVVIMLSVQCGVAALFNFIASQLHQVVFAFIFSGVIGLLKGLSLPLLELAIPMVVGESNMVVGTGVVLLGQGLAGLVGPVLANNIQNATGVVDHCFYLAAGAFLLQFLFTSLTYYLFIQQQTLIQFLKVTGRRPLATQ